MRRRIWLIVVVVVAFLAAGGFALRNAGRPRPIFSFLERGVKKLDSVYVTGDGKARRVQMYRFDCPYSELRKAVDEQVLTQPGWALEKKDVSPYAWAEFWGNECSVEIIDSDPKDFTVKPVGVTWSPPSKRGASRTVFVTRPVAWSEDLFGWLNRLYRNFLRH